MRHLIVVALAAAALAASAATASAAPTVSCDPRGIFVIVDPGPVPAGASWVDVEARGIYGSPATGSTLFGSSAALLRSYAPQGTPIVITSKVVGGTYLGSYVMWTEQAVVISPCPWPPVAAPAPVAPAPVAPAPVAPAPQVSSRGDERVLTAARVVNGRLKAFASRLDSHRAGTPRSLRRVGIQLGQIGRWVRSSMVQARNTAPYPGPPCNALAEAMAGRQASALVVLGRTVGRISRVSRSGQRQALNRAGASYRRAQAISARAYTRCLAS